MSDRDAALAIFHAYGVVVEPIITTFAPGGPHPTDFRAGGFRFGFRRDGSSYDVWEVERGRCVYASPLCLSLRSMGPPLALVAGR